MKTYYSLPKLIAAGKERAVDKSVVSFDLFDTVLIRRIHDPDLVKLPVARFISSLAKKHGKPYEWRAVQRLRDSIEQSHRRATGQRFVDHEACYPRFMEEVLQEIFKEGYSEKILEMVTDYELAMENTMLVARQGFVEWIKELHLQNKRIFIISDMYLPASHLAKLVAHAGIGPQVEQIISSADTFLAKASGKAYSLIIDKFGVSPKQWLHIGDNPISDGLRAEEAGVESLIIYDPGEQQRKSIVKRYYNYSDGKPFWRGRLLQQLMAPLEAEQGSCDALYTQGYNFFAPLLGIFLQEVAKFCGEKGITKIFFLSREGWTFKKFWEQAMAYLYPLGGLPEIEYLYVSRMALAGAACAHQGLTKTNADIAFLPPGNCDFQDVCRIFDLKAEPFVEHLARYDLQVDTCLSRIHDGYDPENRKRFNEMLGDADFQGEVRRQTSNSSMAMQRYFASVGMFDHDNIALIDIGWLGTIQRFLYEAIAHRDDCPRCFGLLFGATRGIPYPETERNSINGIMYDRHRFDLSASTLFYAQDVFEEACRAPHPTLQRYMLTDNGFELTFRQQDDALGIAEQEQDRYFATLQQGIIDGAARFGAAAALLDYSLLDWKPWINYLMVAKLAFPRASEVSVIKHRHHLDDFHGNKKTRSKIKEGNITVWNSSLWRLRFDPFLRLKKFVSHLRRVLNTS